MNGTPNRRHAAAPHGEAGAWLRKQRHYWQITQAELAEQIGIGEVALIDAIEQGEVAMPEFLRDAVALAFSIHRDDMARYCDEWYGQEAAKAA